MSLSLEDRERFGNKRREYRAACSKIQRESKKYKGILLIRNPTQEEEIQHLLSHEEFKRIAAEYREEQAKICILRDQDNIKDDNTERTLENILNSRDEGTVSTNEAKRMEAQAMLLNDPKMAPLVRALEEQKYGIFRNLKGEQITKEEYYKMDEMKEE
jgi:hypothetical protein